MTNKWALLVGGRLRFSAAGPLECLYNMATYFPSERSKTARYTGTRLHNHVPLSPQYPVGYTGQRGREPQKGRAFSLLEELSPK